ncbi:unnamed protein product [Chironomus riparius]|uniref:Odorant receptor n=1 Tax=Chironomus riparius TaxID=315576 RepID=A0A9N9WWI2_9DIPT|nr:unnamed protein product [Chironomus riparius]
MNVLRKFKKCFRPRNRVEKFKTRLIEFEDFFISERFSNHFGLSNLSTQQLEKKTKWKKVLYCISICSLIMLIILELISLIVGLTSDGSPLVLVENVCGFGGTFVILSKLYLTSYYHHEKIKKITATLDTYYPHQSYNQEKYEVQKHLKILKYHEIFGIIIYALAFLTYNLTPLIAQLLSFASSDKLICYQILQLYMPFDQNQIFSCTTLNLASIIMIYFGLFILLLTDLLFAELVALTALELNSLGHKISEIDPNGNQEGAIEMLKEFAKIHEDLLEVTADLEQVYSLILFIDIFGILSSMVTFAFLAFAGFGWLFLIKYSFIFIAASWNAYNASFYGDRLIE